MALRTRVLATVLIACLSCTSELPKRYPGIRWRHSVNDTDAESGTPCCKWSATWHAKTRSPNEFAPNCPDFTVSSIIDFSTTSTVLTPMSSPSGTISWQFCSLPSRNSFTELELWQ
ncbi:hypothetical protein M758_UG073800 [Ceratodon purpureus]|nr:hypothetical protein M758_UG073800 [Ceratodon purpureus]